MTGNLQADGVQSRQTLFVRYCLERTAASVCKEYAILTLATLVMSAGTYLFKFPNNFSFGGVTGLAVVLSAVSHVRTAD